MTGGSVPAMVWQRLMVYAHQNVELKAIPGIEDPFLEETPEAEIADAGEPGAAEPERERPTVLSSRTTRLLLEFSDAFRNAPQLDRPPEPETLSAL